MPRYAEAVQHQHQRLVGRAADRGVEYEAGRGLDLPDIKLAAAHFDPLFIARSRAS
jgi:hypothetical protein